MIQIESKWFDREALDRRQDGIKKNMHQWLIKPNNLTETIKKTGSIFSLDLISQSFDNPYPDEISAFHDYSVDASYSLVRKVFLEGDNHRMIFARVIIPEQTYLNYHSELSNLGCVAIGNAFLYKNEQIVRKDFEYSVIEYKDKIFQELKELNEVNDDDELWARRSIFVLPKGCLLISEVFLNAIPIYPS